MNETELKQVGFECNGAYRALLACQVYLYNPSSSEMSVKDIAVEDNYSLGQLGDVTLDSLDVGEWSIIPVVTLSEIELKNTVDQRGHDR